MMNVPAAPVPSRLLVAAKLTCMLQSLKPVPVTKSPPAKLRLGSMVSGVYGCGEVLRPVGLACAVGPLCGVGLVCASRYLGTTVRIAAVDIAPTARIAAA